MQLSHRPRLDCKQRRGEVCRDWEGERIENLDSAAWHFKWLLLTEVVAVRPVQRYWASLTSDVVLGDILWGRRALEDVQLAIREIVERRCIHAQVLRQYGCRVSLKQLRDKEGVVFAETTI